MSENESFGRLDTVSKPRAEVIVVDACLETLSVQLDQDFKQCEIEILLLCGT